jgi:hypothetical protein
MEPKNRYLRLKKFCKVELAHLIDRILLKCVMFFLDLRLALDVDCSRERLSPYQNNVSNSHLTN